jgi:hypothetical protein
MARQPAAYGVSLYRFGTVSIKIVTSNLVR